MKWVLFTKGLMWYREFLRRYKLGRAQEVIGVSVAGVQFKATVLPGDMLEITNHDENNAPTKEIPFIIEFYRGRMVIYINPQKFHPRYLHGNS